MSVSVQYEHLHTILQPIFYQSQCLCRSVWTYHSGPFTLSVKDWFGASPSTLASHLIEFATHFWGQLTCYRPQTKLRKGNVFTSVCQGFCPRRKGVYPSMHWADTPAQTPPSPVHAGIHTPPPSAYWDIPNPRPPDRNCSGRYASYWNACLVYFKISATYSEQYR